MTDVVSPGESPESRYRSSAQSNSGIVKRIARLDRRIPALPPARSNLQDLTTFDKRVSLLRGHHLFGEDTPADKIFELQDGVLFTYYMSAFGYRRIVAFYAAGDLIGIGPGGLHKLACQALSNATVAVFDRSKLMRLAGKDSRVSARLWSQMATDSQRNEDHILWLGSPAQVRLAGFLLSLSVRARKSEYVDLPMNRRELADFLGLTVETVSRCFTQLRKLGVIQFGDFYRLKIMDDTALEREAGLA
jgi:CRP/FNR family nitrogen fixation transcriptional regulator